MKLLSVHDPEFTEFGRVVDGYDLTKIKEALMKTPCPQDGTIYVASDPAIEDLPEAQALGKILFGGVPFEFGYCNGCNTKLNALEYHRNSEFNLPVGGDCILLLARQQDIAKDHTLDTGTVKAFCIPEGTLVEVYATSLHYAPCQVQESGFRCLVVLPAGTNADLPALPVDAPGEERLLAAVNKWLIAHEDGGTAPGTFIGLTGKNLDVTDDLES